MAGCSTCGACDNPTSCAPFRGELRDYDGIRFTADGFDCAFPVSLDSHNVFSFGCLYCFSNFLARDPHRKGSFAVGQLSHERLEAFLRGEGQFKVYHDALRQVPGMVGPVQWGALGDPFDNVERWQGWALKAVELLKRYNQPTRISTKGGRLLLADRRYLDALGDPMFWIAFSISSIDDEALALVDRGAPTASERLAAMRELSRRGASTSLRMRPCIPGLTDRTPRHPRAYRDLILAAADAGARALSMEVMFWPDVEPPHVRARMDLLVREVGGFDLRRWYKATTPVRGSCLRSSRTWKQELIHACREVAHEVGMVFAVSDPHFKELGDTGCCCGITEDDPVFGGWQRMNATAALVGARRDFDAGGAGLARLGDVVPEWSKLVTRHEMAAVRAGPQYRSARKATWADFLRDAWNDLRGARGPLHYFGGVLRPFERDENGDVVYRYEPWAKEAGRAPGWEVRRGAG